MNPYSNRRKIIITLIFLVLFITHIETQSQQKPTGPQQSQQWYTENIQQFKSKRYNQRLQMVVGCWLMSKEYIDLHKSNYLFFKDLKLKEIVILKLVKECMKKIDRKEAVLKITQLVGKNVQPAKKYEDLVSKQIIGAIFIEISKLTIASYHHYEPINKQAFNSSTQNHNNQSETVHRSMSDQNQTELSSIENTSQQNDDTQNSLYNLSEFDTFLIDLIQVIVLQQQKYNQEFQKLITSKQGLKAKVEEELKKREKYYFGFIPASSFTHSVFLVTISLSMVFCCTCYKYYKLRKTQTQEKKKRISQGNEEGHSHSHSKHKQARNFTKMTQQTMKKKFK